MSASEDGDRTDEGTSPLAGALRSVRDSALAFTYDGDRSSQDHVSGEPQRRDLVLGDEDPRDAALTERVETEQVEWRGKIFDVDRLRVTLPDGRPAIREKLCSVCCNNILKLLQ